MNYLHLLRNGFYAIVGAVFLAANISCSSLEGRVNKSNCPNPIAILKGDMNETLTRKQVMTVLNHYIR